MEQQSYEESFQVTWLISYPLQRLQLHSPQIAVSFSGVRPLSSPAPHPAPRASQTSPGIPRTTVMSRPVLQPADALGNHRR